MDVSKDTKKPRQKKERKSTKTVDIKDTNRYQHWEVRAAFIGAMMNYNPQVKIDMQNAGGIDNWFETLKQSGSTVYPFQEPKLISK